MASGLRALGVGMRWLVLVLCAAGGLSASAEAACDPTGSAVLNELMPNPGAEFNPAGNTDGGYEWVELYNTGAEAISLEGWRIEAASRVSAGLDNPGDYSVLFELPPGTVLEPGAWLVVGGPDLALEGDVDLITAPSFTMGNASSNADAVRLVACDGGVRDVIAYGTNTGDGEFLDEELEAIIAEKLAPKPSDDRSLARVPDGGDTNNPAQDFVRAYPSTPGRSNGEAGASGACTTVGVPGAVVLNELMHNPGDAVNSEGNSDDGYEWVELYNTTSAAIDVTGWMIEQAGTPDHWGTRVRYTMPGGAVLEPGAHLVIAESLAVLPETATVFRLEEGSILALGNSQDAVRLVGCGGVVVDEVVYGGSNPDGFMDGAGVVLTPEQVAPSVADDLSLARRADGYDTDDSGEDFTVASVPTPGGPNADLRCKTTAGGVVINELLPNPSGTDSDALSEWVELYNFTDEPLDVSTWVLVKVNGVEEDQSLSESVLVSLPPGAVVPARGFYTVGGIFADGADHFAESFDLYGATSSAAAVVLYDCAGRRADGVIYGGDNTEVRIPEDSGLVPTDGARKPTDDQCVARLQDGVDTNNSVADFVTTSYCTLGESNVRPQVVDTGGNTLPERGCGGGGPRNVGPVTVDPDAGCRVAPVGSGAGWVVLVGVGLIRRRRSA